VEVMKAAEAMEAEGTMEVMESKAAMKVLEVIAPITTVVWVAVITAKIAARVLRYATTGTGRAQAASAQVCRKCYLIYNYWCCGKH
jgi:hypothetical protein